MYSCIHDNISYLGHDDVILMEYSEILTDESELVFSIGEAKC